MEMNRGVRDKTGHYPREPPSKGSYEEDRMNELKKERERYNANFLGYYNGGLPMKGQGRVRGNRHGKMAMAAPGLWHSPKIHNFLNNYTQESKLVDSEDAIKFKQWMKTDQMEFEMSRPHYKTYYDFGFEFLQDRAFFLAFLLLVLGGSYATGRKFVEERRWHKHDRTNNLREEKAHHYNNRGGVLIKKEFIGFNKYFKTGDDQMEWLRMAYPAIYTEVPVAKKD